MIGQIISHYQIMGKLGEGGMGVVWKARDTQLERFVALKTLPADKVADASRRARFLHEARAASALNHPHIVTIHDIIHQEGTSYLVMECIEGKALDQLIPRKGMGLNEALKIGIQVADALTAAHKLGIVHRDLKPGNVMVTLAGQVKVLDFGLAKLIEPDTTPEEAATRTVGPATEDGVIVGTVAYMSPEQAQGKPVDSRSDIFSFGVLLYEMVTGQRAFHGDSRLSTLAAVLKEEPKTIPDAPRDLEKILSRCLRKDPERRAQHMGDVKLALEELKEESESGSLAVPASKVAKSGRRWLWPVLAALVAAVGAAVYFSLLTKQDEPVSLAARPLTTFPGSEGDPSLSPDGNQVAFTWNGANRDNPDIYVMMIAGGPPLRLTTNPARDHAPAWSPDGSQIAFIRSEGRADYRESVILISPLGGPERKLTELTGNFGGSYLVWTPDGKYLALTDRSALQDPVSIYLYSPSTGEKRRLTTPPPGNWGDMYFAFSNDGKWLAFTRYPTSTNADLFLLALPSGEPKLISPMDRGSLAWSPTGEFIYRNGGRSFRLAPSANNPRPKPAAGQVGGSVTISRAGRMVFTAGSTDSNIWRLDLSGRASKPEQLIASTRVEVSPQVSPDGSRVAFSSNRSGNPEIWVADSTGSNPVQLTSLKANSTHSPRWSPDGSLITFASESGGNRDVYVMDASGGSLRRLTQDSTEEGRPIWSNDGKFIYFYSYRTGSQQTWKILAGGGSWLQVTSKGGNEAQESPDGAYLYYATGTFGKGLFRRPIAGGEDELILEKASSGWWAVTDRGVIFASFDTDALTSQPPIPIQFWDAATRKITTLGTIEKPVSRQGASLSATRDGKVIVWPQIDSEDSDLMVVEGFR